MTQLTWKDTDIPDFRGTMDGYIAASKMFGQAIGSAKDMLGGIERDQSNAAANAVMDSLLRYQGDPAKLESDLASGAFQGQFDPKVMARLNPEMRQTLLNRPKELLAHYENTLKVNEAEKAIGESDRARALAPKINELQTLQLKDPSGKLASEYIAANPDLKENLDSRRFQSTLTDGLALGGQQFGRTKDITSFTQEQEEREIGVKAGRLMGELRGFLPQDRLTYVTQNRGKLDQTYGPQAVDRILAELDTQSAGPGGGSPAGLGGTGGGGVGGAGTGIGGRPIYSVLLGDTANGGNAYGITPPKPIEQMTMGELHNFQRNVMIPRTKAAGIGKTESGQIVGSSAAGAYQIVSTTLERKARQLFGEGWRDKTFDAATQDALGEALFEEAKANGTDLHKVWEGLPAGTNPKNLTWAQVRDQITMKESGGTVTNPREAKAFQDAALEHQYATNPLTPLEVGFKENFNNTSSAKQMAMGLVASKEFEGENVDDLGAVIQKVADDYDLSPALAAVAVRHAANGRDGAWRRPFSNMFGDGINVFIDGTKLEANAKRLQDRAGMAAKVSDTVTRGDRMASTGQAQQMLVSAKAALEAKRLAYRQRGITDPSKMNLTNELMDVATAEAMVEGTLGKGKEFMLAGEEPDPVKPGRRPAGPNPSKPLIVVARPPSRTPQAPGRGPLLTAGGGGDAARVNLAMNSGLPQFARKSGESQSAWQARVSKIVLGK